MRESRDDAVVTAKEIQFPPRAEKIQSSLLELGMKERRKREEGRGKRREDSGKAESR